MLTLNDGWGWLIPVRLPLIRQIKLACGKRRIPFICAHPFSKQYPSTASTNHEFRCSTDTPMAPFLTLQRDLAQAAPDAPHRSSWHRRIVAVYPFSSNLSGWGVGTHSASDYAWIPPSSVGPDHYLSFLSSLDPFPCEFALWQKNKQQKKKGIISSWAYLSPYSSLLIFLLCALLSQSRGMIHTWTNDHIIDSLLLSWAPNYSRELTSLK